MFWLFHMMLCKFHWDLTQLKQKQVQSLYVLKQNFLYEIKFMAITNLFIYLFLHI